MFEYQMFVGDAYIGPYVSQVPVLKKHWMLISGTYYQVLVLKHCPSKCRSQKMSVQLREGTPGFLDEKNGHEPKIVLHPGTPINIGDVIGRDNGSIEVVQEVIHNHTTPRVLTKPALKKVPT